VSRLRAVRPQAARILRLDACRTRALPIEYLPSTRLVASITKSDAKDAVRLTNAGYDHLVRPAQL
jgi:hypothetical protein